MDVAPMTSPIGLHTTVMKPQNIYDGDGLATELLTKRLCNMRLNSFFTLLTWAGLFASDYRKSPIGH